MSSFSAVLVIFLLLFANDAFAQRDDTGFCLAKDQTTQRYYYSDAFAQNSSKSTEQYQTEFSEALKSHGIALESHCQFTKNAAAIPVYLDGLKQQCSDCSVWTIHRVQWKPGEQTAKSDVAADAAPFKTKGNRLDSEAACAGFTEANYRQVALSGEPDTQLKTMCGMAFEYYSMYKRAISQGASEQDANRTFTAHEGAARTAIEFYKNSRAN